ncbi:MAG: transporter substrate-binding domain-containing protein [Eubacteriales bacterium]
MKLKNMMALALAAALTLTMAGCSKKEEESNTLRVAMECAYAPFNWTQSDDSNGAYPIADSNDYAYGYDVMMAIDIAEAAGMELEIVKMDWDALIPALQSGSVDMVIAGQCITSDRAAQVDFSDPYYYAYIVSLVKSDGDFASAQGITDFAGASATSQLGTVWYDTMLPQVENIELLPAQESVPAMLVALDSGAVDLVVTDQPTALAACQAYTGLTMLDFASGDDNFEINEEDVVMGISVKQGNTDLLDIVNEYLSQYDEADFSDMMNAAIEVQPLNQ